MAYKFIVIFISILFPLFYLLFENFRPLSGAKAEYFQAEALSVRGFRDCFDYPNGSKKKPL